MIEEIEKGQNMIEKLKPINLRDVAYSTARALAHIRGTTTTKSWKKLLEEIEAEIIEPKRTDEMEEIS